MTHTDALSPIQPSQPSLWLSINKTKLGLIAVLLALCPSLLPAASAQCGGRVLSPRLHAIPSLPGMLTAPASANERASSATPTSGASIVGLWKIDFLSGGAIVDVAFDAWNSDGTEILNDFTDPIEGNVCLGVWTAVGTRSYKLKHPSWYFDTNGVLQGTVIIHESVTLSADGATFSGPAVEDIYDVSGNLLDEETGLVKAMRITAN